MSRWNRPTRRPKGWAVSPEMRAAVFRRDGACAAPRLDPDAGRCWGRSTIEHVKSDLRMGVRAPSDMEHCIALCEGHTEAGTRAGSAWNTRKESRELVRGYLATFAQGPAGEP